MVSKSPNKLATLDLVSIASLNNESFQPSSFDTHLREQKHGGNGDFFFSMPPSGSNFFFQDRFGFLRMGSISTQAYDRMDRTHRHSGQKTKTYLGGLSCTLPACLPNQLCTLSTVDQGDGESRRSEVHMRVLNCTINEREKSSFSFRSSLSFSSNSRVQVVNAFSRW